jgi:acyl-CoA thioester hydrolase
MRKVGSLNAEIEAQVPFHDVDLAGVVWHGHYVKYLENARWALMERIGHDLDDMLASGYGWPVVDLQLKYVRYSRFRDRIRVRASLVEWEHRLAINYLITDAASGERVARARTVQVAVDIATGSLQFVSPPDFVERVRAALGQS